MPSSASKNRSYNGPKTHRAIIRKIREEMYATGARVSYNFIDRVIRRFFSFTGIGYYFKRAESFFVRGLGTFIMTAESSRMMRAKKMLQRRKFLRRRRKYAKAQREREKLNK